MLIDTDGKGAWSFIAYILKVIKISALLKIAKDLFKETLFVFTNFPFMNLYFVDSFTDSLFSGNPAGVLITSEWLSDKLMQSIAAENNLAETAFVVPEANDFGIRWFTPVTEVDLCGHATLASAYVMFNELDYPKKSIHFHSKSGLLSVTKDGDWLTLDFPADTMHATELTPDLQKTTSANILEAYKGRSDYMLVLPDEKAVHDSHFNLGEIKKLGNRGVIFTAEGSDVDFVSRFFAPAVGVDEDPVTGSAHTSLTPYWVGRLGKNNLTAKQLSARGGFLKCTLQGDRVLMSGQARLYMKGKINIE